MTASEMGALRQLAVGYQNLCPAWGCPQCSQPARSSEGTVRLLEARRLGLCNAWSLPHCTSSCPRPDRIDVCTTSKSNWELLGPWAGFLGNRRAWTCVWVFGLSQLSARGPSALRTFTISGERQPPLFHACVSGAQNKQHETSFEMATPPQGCKLLTPQPSRSFGDLAER